MIWKKQRDSCVTFYRDVIRFAFQLANMSVKLTKGSTDVKKHDVV